MRYYVDITGISDAFLAFMGYEKVATGLHVELYVHMRTDRYFALAKSGKRCLFVDDVNDAETLKDYRVAPCPPWN